MNPPPDTPTPSAGIASEMTNEQLKEATLTRLRDPEHLPYCDDWDFVAEVCRRLTPDRPKGGGELNTVADAIGQYVETHRNGIWCPEEILTLLRRHGISSAPSAPPDASLADGRSAQYWKNRWIETGHMLDKAQSALEVIIKQRSAPPDAAAIDKLALKLRNSVAETLHNPTPENCNIAANFREILTRHLRAQPDAAAVELEGYITTAPERPTGEGWQHVASTNYGNTWMWARPRHLRAQPVKEDAKP